MGPVYRALKDGNMHMNSKLRASTFKVALHEFPFLRKRLDRHMLEVVNGASVAFVLKVLGAGLAFGFNILLARMFGAEGAGIYFLALTITAIATVIGRIGLDNTLVRFVAANASTGDWASVKGVYRKGITLALAASAASAAVMFASAPWLSETVFGKPGLAQPLRLMSLAVVPMAMLILHAQALVGLKRIRDSLLVQAVGVQAMCLVGLCVLGEKWGVNGAVGIYILAAALTALIGHAVWRAAAPQLRYTAGRFETRKLLRSSIPLFWVESLNLVMMWAAIFMLGMWKDTADVGIFAIASRTAALISFVLIAVNSIAAPKFAALYRQGDMDALGSTARNSAKLMTLMAGPALLLFIVAPEWVLAIFGPQFVEGATVLAILAAGRFVAVVIGSVNIYLLIMSGREHLLRNTVAIAGAANILLNIWLIPPFGLIGAAVATAASLSLQSLIACYLVYSRINIKTIPWHTAA